MVAALDSLIGEGLSKSPYQEALAECERLEEQRRLAFAALLEVMEALGVAFGSDEDVVAVARKLREFKAYTHKRLDELGVPHTVPSPHTDAGCRVGGRFDWLDEQDKLRRWE